MNGRREEEEERLRHALTAGCQEEEEELLRHALTAVSFVEDEDESKALEADIHRF
ncbi:hypothetical protein T484DRAFT_1802366 [Baffinella frigidus]|nr:hypothetical protein T484DRAFT_1802366 [Cryptophyta sp. CCMP2293]